MARSKFPGKPSKPVKRRRINVLKVGNSESLESSTSGLQENYNETVSHSNTSGRCVRSKCGAKRKPVKVQLNRSGVTKRRRIASTTHVKTRSTIQTGVKRSEKQISNCSNKKNNLESNNLVGKFVLPSRSAHSSRVIKPNKRFLNVDSVTNVQLRTVVKRPVYKRKPSESKVPQSSLEIENQENVDTGMPRLSNSTNRRIILRQARLQLDTQRGKGLEGPFSSNYSSSNTSPPGTVTCGVCGAVRFYRFVNQARKFNIFSCESCRKFISKMIKRQRCNKSTMLQCLKGQGACLVPPVLRSQLWKSRCAYKARCNACWLKMCLRSFQMPQLLKTSLMEVLPEYMQENNTTVFNNSSLFSFHTTNVHLNTNTNAQSDLPAIIVPQRVLRRKVEKDIEKSNIPLQTEIKRQKIDFKGPRVKHVCRSASIVLGQAVAMFSETCDKQVEPIGTFKDDASENKENDLSKDQNGTKPFTKLKCVALETNQELAGLAVSRTLPSKADGNVMSLASKRDRDKSKQQNSSQTNYFSEIKFTKKPADVNRICFDFWENYDPDEICQSGFGLISSSSFPMFAICFLCGSAGQDPLLYCCSCCEPYHPFCLEQTPLNINPSNQYYDWICPRCIRCTACGEISKKRMHCHKCHKPYHPECFNKEWRLGSRPIVCSSCMRCKSCGTANITKFIGNTLLCIKCFKLRNKGNFCPLCHECYDEDDYNIKMMECGKCNMWVHAKCEGLSDEQYQILSTLPDSIEFLCCICDSSPYWRKAVDSELKSCFNKILKLLSKNKVVRATLKWNALHFKPPLVKSSAVRKIMFVDPETEDISEISNGDSIDLNQMDFQPCPNIGNAEVFLDNTEKHIFKTPTSPSLASIKNKINCQDFLTLREFNLNMEEVIEGTQSIELSNIYHCILKEIVPWFDPSVSVGDPTDHLFCDTLHINNCLSSASVEENKDFRYKIINNIDSDTRLCVLCKGIGDGLCYKEGRMIYCGNNEWIHANCAIWSSEVYEEIDGSLQNVHAAISRGRSMSCTHCKLKGASIGCCSRACNEIYHFPCAYNKQCYFMHDKSFYCHSHYQPGEISSLSSTSEFILSRSVYVELDQRKKRYTESKKVQFMVGSLTITALGVIVPQVSDNAEALIPINFSCRRLFWSTTEPWKLVPYVITTAILSNENPTKLIERNFTVDHSLPKGILSEKLKELSLWQNDADVYIDDDEEPQNENSPDLLSPELTDAILEELPLGVLDRISMQDIFPRLMGNEELLASDFKLTDICNTEVGFIEVNKKMHLVEEEGVIDDKKNCMVNSNKFPNLHNQQRCSLSLSCKVDKSTSSNSNGKSKNLYFPLVQVDGACDNSSSDCDSTAEDVEDLYTPQLSDEPVKCQRCQCTYRTAASYNRHLETCNSISMTDDDSESDNCLDNELIETTLYTSVPTSQSDNIGEISGVQSSTEHPFVVSSFESYTSIQAAENEVHSSTVNTRTFLSSEVMTEVLPVPQNEIYYSSFHPDVDNKSNNLYTSQNTINTNTFPITINQPINCETSQITLGRAQTLTYNQQATNHVLNQNNSMYLSQSHCNQPATISIVQPSSVPINSTGTISINASTPLHINQPIEIQQTQQLTIQSAPMQQDTTSLIHISPQNQITLGTTKLLPSHYNVSQNQILRPAVTSKTVRPRGRPRSLAIKKTTRPAYFLPQRNSGMPSVVLHQLPSSNMIPTFLEAFQQQTGQNLQFVTSITPQIAPVVNQPHLVQFQPENSVVNLMPTMQSTVILPQAPVLSDQIIVDNSNSLIWSPQHIQTIQPVLYGFETIVQNTVLQSQQFLPSTVPGILTANSSFSSTTQVFQTSKLEPVLDVTSGNFVLVNSNPIVNAQSLSVPEHIANDISAAKKVLIEHKPIVTNNYVQATADTTLAKEVLQTAKCTSTLVTNSVSNKTGEINQKCNILEDITIKNPISTNVNTSISLKVLRCKEVLTSSENGIPTNIVTPTLKAVSATTQSRPMNRVLPMPTKTSKVYTIKNIKRCDEIPTSPLKPKTEEKTFDVLVDDLIKPNFEPVVVTGEVEPVKVISDFEVSKEKEPLKSNTSDVLKKFTQYSTADSLKPIIQQNILIPKKVFNLNQDIQHKSITPTINIKENSEVITNNSLNEIESNNLDKGMDNLNKELGNLKDSIPQNSSVTETYKNELCTESKDKSVNFVDTNNTNFKGKSVNLNEKWTRVVEAKNPNLNIKNSRLVGNLTSVYKKTSNSIEKSSNSIEKSSNLIEKSLKIMNAKEKNSHSKEKMINLNEKVLNGNAKVFRNEKGQQNGENVLVYSVETLDGFNYTSTSLTELWTKVFDSVQTARLQHDMLPLPSNSLNMMNGLQLLGLKANGLKYLLEQLPGTTKCSKYKPIFEFNQQEVDSDEDDMKIDISRGARSMQYTRSHDPSDMFGWLASKHRNPIWDHYVRMEENARRGGVITNLPMAMKFRNLKLVSKHSVGVYRSKIHRRGLFCHREIESGDMVIEYAGEVIRSILADQREKQYIAKGMGCYMFRIDENFVVDATMKGNAARFINHSCEPNCYSKVIEVLGHKHIVIFALRKIGRGEELTYDYKFPFEEDKIPCTCGTRRCRKFLN